eukprot:m.43073 g.43073  ORF g.43073 m.43073 type:complete len:60 (-) comp8391_c0_seq1:702-881(-)
MHARGLETSSKIYRGREIWASRMYWHLGSESAASTVLIVMACKSLRGACPARTPIIASG